MISKISTASLLAGFVLLSACSRDAQTEQEVTTRTSGGEASTSMSGDSADKRGEALVRVVNAVPETKSLTIRADETHALPSVEYKGVTPYHSIDRNWVTFQVSRASDATYAPIETNREMLTDGHRYTIVVMRENDAAGLKTRVIRDDLANDATKAQVRVINAAEGFDEIDVRRKGVNDDDLFSGVNVGSEAGFKAIDPWAGTLEFRAEDGKRLLATIAKADLQAGKSYTIVLAPGKSGKLDAFWFEDAPTQ
ncbi:MAG: DUF4397 domain-containing protein [Cytophagaceae bacterium]|nr:DUF4397 domain-containing protein [Gemmatimonadaceae bacterium]